jgi:hypothetical protein
MPKIEVFAPESEPGLMAGYDVQLSSWSREVHAC